MHMLSSSWSKVWHHLCFPVHLLRNTLYPAVSYRLSPNCLLVVTFSYFAHGCLEADWSVVLVTLSGFENMMTSSYIHFSSMFRSLIIALMVFVGVTVVLADKCWSRLQLYTIQLQNHGISQFCGSFILRVCRLEIQISVDVSSSSQTYFYLGPVSTDLNPAKRVRWYFGFLPSW